MMRPMVLHPCESKEVGYPYIWSLLPICWVSIETRKPCFPVRIKKVLVVFSSSCKVLTNYVQRFWRYGRWAVRSDSIPADSICLVFAWDTGCILRPDLNQCNTLYHTAKHCNIPHCTATQGRKFRFPRHFSSNGVNPCLILYFFFGLHSETPTSQ